MKLSKIGSKFQAFWPPNLKGEQLLKLLTQFLKLHSISNMEKFGGNPPKDLRTSEITRWKEEEEEEEERNDCS